MRIGVVFPQVEIGLDPGAIRDYAQAVEAMGLKTPADHVQTLERFRKDLLA